LNRSENKELGSITIAEEDFKHSLEELFSMVKETSQQLQVANLQIERAEYERSLARLDYLPDFTLGFDYIEVGGGETTQLNDGEDAWMGKIAVNLPVWFNRLGAEFKEKDAGLEASQHNYQDAENNINYQVEDLYFKITAYKDIISLYESALIPQSEQSLQAAKTAYETGRVDFINWLDAEKTLLQTGLAYYKAIVDYHKSIAYLERVVGRDL